MLKRALSPIALTMLLWTAGCATDDSSVVVCPTLVEYAPGRQSRAADELAALPADAALREMMRDYAALRDQVRACR